MWNIAGFELSGFRLDMSPGDHFPHHFHLSCDDFDIRILYRRSVFEQNIQYTVVWRKSATKKWKPLSAKEEAELLELMNRFIEELEEEWNRLHE